MNNTALVTFALLACAGFACAQSSGEPAPKPAEPAQPSQPPADDPLPSLDDLLGLPRDRESARKTPAPDTAKAELDRMLSPAEAAEEFREAVNLMGETAKRLGDSRDTGLQTQRLQEDIVRKLDMLIRAAEQQSQRSRSSSSRSSSRQEGDQQNQPGQQQAEQQQAGQGDNRSENEPPSRQEGPLNPELPGAHGAEWGALPQRVRDALVQGRADKFSALYERLTQAYFRKLAEESSR